MAPAAIAAPMRISRTSTAYKIKALATNAMQIPVCKYRGGLLFSISIMTAKNFESRFCSPKEGPASSSRTSPDSNLISPGFDLSRSPRRATATTAALKCCLKRISAGVLPINGDEFATMAWTSLLSISETRFNLLACFSAIGVSPGMFLMKRTELAPAANHAMSLCWRISSGETAWRVTPFLSIATKNALGSCLSPADCKVRPANRRPTRIGSMNSWCVRTCPPFEMLSKLSFTSDEVQN